MAAPGVRPGGLEGVAAPPLVRMNAGALVRAGAVGAAFVVRKSAWGRGLPEEPMSTFQPFWRWPDFAKICRDVSRAVNDYAMLADGDRVLVGLSGGEDSLTLMHVLTFLRRRAPFRFSLTAATVDMGFATFDLESLGAYCRVQGWEWESVTIPGQSLLVDKDAEERPCALCSRLRRGQLHALADRLGCNKIALGQQLDDLCVSFLMALFRGGGLKTMGPNVAADQASKRLIRPMCTITKDRVSQFARRMDYPSVRSCPYQDDLRRHGDRFFLEQLLKQLEQRFPDLRSTMLRGLQDVRLAHLLDLRYLHLQGEQHDPDAGKL